MSLAIAYVVFVLVGPVVFVGLIRPAPTRARFAMGAVSALGLMGAAFAMRVWGQGAPVAAMGWLACLWLGWIVTIAVAVQAWALARGMAGSGNGARRSARPRRCCRGSGCRWR